MSACTLCGHDPGVVATLGPLRVETEPLAAYWFGLRMEGLPPVQCRILHLLASRGRASYLALLMTCVGEEATDATLKVQICYLRQRLPPGLRIMTERGWGYRLETDP